VNLRQCIVKGAAVAERLVDRRVEAVEPDRLLRLAAEMKVPGRAWLEFEVTENDGKSTMPMRMPLQTSAAG